ncbi:hypothetical protein PPTG_06661 [Phytophthora nicotianae INRA-310]|uniref:Uncharacterized protein n=1 Tax=Phytophthora nicotianae (strain INRA-310) TaxID=761204 RepID=W2QQB7_PHYN3|nr:hypothetical protein PPTG_06661 [Phytophthora nicotianae INRA-310]ETN15387.1 hypothetical protein PPTG_06661 [Phytophthora nicotianae INRA-310]
MKQLHQTIDPSISKGNLLSAAYSLCHYHDKFTKEERKQVQVRSCFPHQLSIEGRDLLSKLENENLSIGPTFPPSSNTQSMPTMKNVLPTGCGPPVGSRWSTMKQPVSPTRIRSVQVTCTKRSRNVNAITAVPSVQHIASLRKTLSTLFTIECTILADARFHTELTDVTEDNVMSTVYMVFLYGLLEFGSFVLLMIILKRGCGMQALYHLAFVLETQMLSIQSEIIGWMLITFGF